VRKVLSAVSPRLCGAGILRVSERLVHMAIEAAEGAETAEAAKAFSWQSRASRLAVSAERNSLARNGSAPARDGRVADSGCKARRLVEPSRVAGQIQQKVLGKSGLKAGPDKGRPSQAALPSSREDTEARELESRRYSCPKDCRNQRDDRRIESSGFRDRGCAGHQDGF
jgi:hypothetical protein